MSHSWPGNIRELQNAISRAGALAQADRIEPQDLVPGIRSRPQVPLNPGGGRTLKDILDETAEATIRTALKNADGNISQAARLLGISRQHLHTKLRALDISTR
jgi:transcriptional regulator of acetoin/glycerol metabolism